MSLLAGLCQIPREINHCQHSGCRKNLERYGAQYLQCQISYISISYINTLHTAMHRTLLKVYDTEYI